MNPISCPHCSRPEAEAPACPDCGRPFNGESPRHLPAGVPDGRLPQEYDAWERQQFDEEAFLAGLHEVELTGGVELKDFVTEIERGPAPGE